ncbi:MAG: GNAT family N-acetyltransferase [Proteobacteria bacterium]|nr:GNAT family N-acetyltransferase [Pseudomonadota bacterium]MBU1140303.1 GNAT family N-acetyltransferase [Pseudomonadota bacterium]
MKVIDLQPEYYDTYFNCLEDWSDEMKEAGNHKACWYRKYREKGLRVKLSLDAKGRAAGMIQYLPVEESVIDGKGLCFILCIWVHGYKKGIGDFRGKGMGTALLHAAENDARTMGAKGMAAWGLWLPFWMKASWFKKHGYKTADRDGMRLLVWKPFSDDANPPHWIHPRKAVPKKPGKVTVTAFINGWCPAQNIVFERAKRACGEFGDKVVFETMDMSDHNAFLEWGISDGIFIDGKQISFGPPLPYEKIVKKIAKQVDRLS